MIAEDFSKISGGVPAVVQTLSGRMARLGFEVHVVCSHINPMQPDSGVTLHHVPAFRMTRKWYYGKKLSSTLKSLASLKGATIFHIHGVWSAPQYLSAKIAADRGIPYVISAHGMLDPWLWEKQGIKRFLKKKLYWNILGKIIFRKASVMHAITNIEKDDLRKLSLGGSIFVVPNAFDAGKSADEVSYPYELKKRVLFLGRIEPKKGVDLLLRAFIELKLGKDWKLTIAGPSWSDSYLAEIKQIASAADPGSIEFLGPVFGAEKKTLLCTSWALAVPSYCEVIGLVNLEAAAFELPSITTHRTGLAGWDSGGGILIQPDVAELKAAINTSCSWSLSERRQRGAMSKIWAERNYSWNLVEPIWEAFYLNLASSCSDDS